MSSSMSRSMQLFGCQLKQDFYNRLFCNSLREGCSFSAAVATSTAAQCGDEPPKLLALHQQQAQRRQDASTGALGAESRLARYGAQSRRLAQQTRHTSTNSLSSWMRGAKTVAAVRDSHASETIRQSGHSGAVQGTQQVQSSHTRDEFESSETVRGSEVDAMAYMSEESLMPNVPKRVNSASHPGVLGSSEAEDSAQGGARHPAMDEIPLLEQYMKLRASGHHVSEEDEQRIMNAMLARVAEVQNFESTESQWAAGTRGALDDDPDDVIPDPLLPHHASSRSITQNAGAFDSESDLAELAKTPASEITQEFTQDTTLAELPPLSGNDTSRHAAKAHEQSSKSAKRSDSDAWSTGAGRQAMRTGISGEVGISEAQSSTSVPSHKETELSRFQHAPRISPAHTHAQQELSNRAGGSKGGYQEPGRQTRYTPGRQHEEIKRWFPKKNVIDDEARRQDALLRRLSFQAHDMLGLSRQLSDAIEDYPDFLLDASEELSQEDSLAMSNSAYAASPPPEQKASLKDSAADEQQVYSGSQYRSAASGMHGKLGKQEEELYRFGVIGLPNAGKSTITNWLAGGTISAVSVRPETTRKPVLGAFTRMHKQVVMYDTPGMHGTHDYRTRSESMRVGASWQHSLECGALGLIVDAYRFSRSRKKASKERKAQGRSKRADPELEPKNHRNKEKDIVLEDDDEEWHDDDRSTQSKRRDHRDQVFELAEAIGSKRGPPGFYKGWEQRPAVLIVNKSDLLIHRPGELLNIVRHLSHACEFSAVFFVSAQNGAGMSSLREHLLSQCELGQWEFAAHQPSEQTWPQLAAELVREKLYWAHNREVPYKLRPVCERVEDADDGKVHAYVDILVGSERYKDMVAGKQGGRTKRIENRVGAELAHMMKRYVQVHIRVKVKKNAYMPPMEE